jgi:hypothetical protein
LQVQPSFEGNAHEATTGKVLNQHHCCCHNHHTLRAGGRGRGRWRSSGVSNAVRIFQYM